MPRNTPMDTNRLSRYFNETLWCGYCEFEEHEDAKEFAKLCRANDVKARVIKLAESRQWHGAVERSIIYVPDKVGAEEAEKRSQLWLGFVDEKNTQKKAK